MKKRNIFLILLAAVLLPAAGWVAWHFETLSNFSHVISSYYAKEMCSCLYVVGQTEQTCHGWVKQWIPISHYETDPRTQTVTVTGLGRTNRARYVDPRYGCVLDPLP